MKPDNTFLFFLVLMLFLFSGKSSAQYDEKYRPQFHFSPKKGWIGDPDGLIHFNGIYHLFWWGHAVSKDLIHWEELPYPMQGSDNSFSYFSGSVVVDEKNTSGFGANSMIAIYTMHKRGDSLPETQGLSVSNDYVNFNFYNGNPVLDVRKIFFRDPQVFWYAPTQRWIMVVTVPDMHKIHFYSSLNLKDWTFLSEFGDIGARSAFWECPDLIELNVDGDTTKKKWVLLIGQGPNRVQYFIGKFDGKKFKADETTSTHLNEGVGIPGFVFETFEGNDYGKWKTSGTAFGTRPDNSDSIIRIGKGNVSSSWNSDTATGTLTSMPFVIKQNAISFLIAGGDHPGQTCVNLIINNKVVHSSSGNNSAVFKWEGWDVSDFKGQKAIIQIVDSYSQINWGHINVDHIIFTNIMPPQKLQHALWLDYGTDFYATRSIRYLDSVKLKPTMIGWMGNWQYARDVPSGWGKGFESIPREMALKRFPEGIRLVQNPVEAVSLLRKDSVLITNRIISGTGHLPEFKPGENSYEIEAVFETDHLSTFGFNLLIGAGRKLSLIYNPKTSTLCLDRTNCTDYISDVNFTKKFATKMFAPVETENNRITLQILVDHSSIEIFANRGKVAISAVTYPSPSQTGVEIFSNNGKTKLESFKGWKLGSIWK